ncbi:MAG: 5-(carboxyamino)imidazole ribonucleotide mutase [Planctomycetes bacterium]|nr:5-(carboxyamino)imidazole ribonucleotide mutase [Planctomycetota bacterium]MCW8134214.1 5-(carboxyamino)imidazole ribonucleotide mutase [Planctomycetota bacterium]
MPDVVLMMGSDSDWPTLEPVIATLRELGVTATARVLSAHRTPDQARAFVAECEKGGTKVFICAAGVAAHLAGAVAAHTARPVIGIPVASGPLNGFDALLSTVQMPPGVPVATVAINGAVNAAVLAAQIIATGDNALHEKLVKWRASQTLKVLEKDKRLQEKLQG